MSAISQINQIVAMQIELNERTVTDWINQNLDWDAAVLVEVAEAVDSTAWKWWKHGTDDLINLQIEAVDILHFLISKALVQFKDPGLVSEKIAEIASRNQPTNLPAVDWLKQIALYTLENKVMLAIQALFGLFSALEMDLNEVHQSYISKNLLNHYRQERGYNDPAANYRKIINGEEDNLVFKKIVAEFGSGIEDLTRLKQVLFSKMDEA